MTARTDTVEAASRPSLLARFTAGARPFLHNRAFVAGAILLAIIVIATLATPLLTDRAPNALAIRDRFKPPSFAFPLGTDSVGRDVASRLIYGGRVSITIGLIVMVGGEARLFARHEPLLRSLGTPRLIGPVGHAATLKLAMNQLIAGLTAVGGAERCLEITLDYMKGREAFGKPLTRFPGAGSLDGRIQRQQTGLPGNLFNKRDLFRDLLHGLDENVLAQLLRLVLVA